MRVVHVAGVRPNFMKIAPITRALGAYPEVEQILVHTGQHYDFEMSQVFFDDLGIAPPDVNLALGSDDHGAQTGRIMIELERVIAEFQPDFAVVVGDVDSTMAAALASVKLGVPVAHVEAGLRAFDRTMPEEINRVVTDRVASVLFTPSADADENLIQEGIAPDTIHRVGNVMIDSLVAHLDEARARPVLDAFGLRAGGYALATLHRPANVDDPEVLSSLVGTLRWIQERLPVVLPLHPRTKDRLAAAALLDEARALPGLHLTEPQGYLDFVALTANAKFALTDSGGLQEETTYLGVPCLTLRACTERPATVEIGTNLVVGSDRARIQEAVGNILAGGGKKGSVPPLWDGHASERAAHVLIDYMTRSRTEG